MNKLSGRSNRLVLSYTTNNRNWSCCRRLRTNRFYWSLSWMSSDYRKRRSLEYRKKKLRRKKNKFETLINPYWQGSMSYLNRTKPLRRLSISKRLLSLTLRYKNEWPTKLKTISTRPSDWRSDKTTWCPNSPRRRWRYRRKRSSFKNSTNNSLRKPRMFKKSFRLANRRSTRSLSPKRFCKTIFKKSLWI